MSIVISNRSPISGKVNEMVIPMTGEDFDAAYAAWQNGKNIQDAFPMLSADAREFIKTGILPEEWPQIDEDID